MARYRIAHDLDRTWICVDQNGSYYWGQYEAAKLFRNYHEAKAALDTLPVEKRMYGFPYKPTFMKFYDNEEHMRREDEYLQNKRLLRSWGY